jgi:hypothetical protein
MDRRHRILPAAFVVSLAVTAGPAACGGGSPLASLHVDVTSSGWSAAGGDRTSTRYVPVVQLTIANTGSTPIDNVDVFLSFWPDGADGEKDVQQVGGMHTRELRAGDSTPALLIRSAVGYNLPGGSADLFSNSAFRDWTVKIYARRAGRIVALGDFPIARRLVGTESAASNSSFALGATWSVSAALEGSAL